MLTFLAALMMALQAADVWTTRRFLALGLAEGNPVINWLMDRYGPLWWVPKIVAATGATALLWWAGSVLWMGVACAAYAAVIGWNLWHIERKRG